MMTIKAQVADQMNWRTRQAIRISAGRSARTLPRRELSQPKAAIRCRASGAVSAVKISENLVAPRSNAPDQRRGVSTASRSVNGRMIQGNRCWID
jgi:hypothetical protein